MAKHGKTKAYSKQHFVPQSYTKAWCDPESEEQPLVAPYVWVFDHQGQNPRAKSPSKLFTETDIYTVPMPNGDRDLVLEHGFQQLEDSFAKLRRLRLSKRKNLSRDEVHILQIFVATAKARTAAYRDFQRKQWRGLREKVELFHEDIRNATEAEIEAMRRASKIGIGRGGGRGTITIQDIKQMEDFPIQELITPTLSVVLPIYARMSMAVLCTDDETGFITSDSPVTWFNPEAYKLPPLMRSPGLAQQGIEVTFPISPNLCLALTHNPDFNGYINISKQALTELNRRHIAHCSENFISRSKATNEEWFRKGEIPPDAWENRHRTD